VYNNNVAVRVVMPVMLVNNHGWFVSDDDFIGTDHRCDCQKGKRELKIFSLPAPIRFSQRQRYVNVTPSAGAIIALSSFCDGVDMHVITAKLDQKEEHFRIPSHVQG
jgi:hypothetical protein